MCTYVDVSLKRRSCECVQLMCSGAVSEVFSAKLACPVGGIAVFQGRYNKCASVRTCSLVDDGDSALCN